MEPLEDWISVTRPHGVHLVRHTLQPDSTLAASPSDAVVLVWALAGDVELEVDEDSVTLQAASVVLLPRGQAHRLASVGPEATVLCGAYSGSRCPVTSVWAGLPEIVRVDPQMARDEPRIALVGDLIEHELESPDHGSQPLLGTLMDALMMYLLRAWSRNSDQGPSWMAGLQDPVLSEPLRELHRAPSENWTIERLARIAGVSRAVFARQFSERMGEPPMQYVRRWRMAMATRMLMYTDDSVGEIAERVGYTSEFAFNRAFKRTVGQAPGRFRRDSDTGS